MKGAMLKNYRLKTMTTGYKVDNRNKQKSWQTVRKLQRECEALLGCLSFGFQLACGWFSSRLHLWHQGQNLLWG